MSKLGKPRSSKGLAVLCAKLSDEKLARDILILNLTKIEYAPSDYFVLCTCDSEAQTRAVVDLILTACSELKIQKPRKEGMEGGYWILLDFFDVVVHIMQREAREYYKLEKLWGDAQFMQLTESGTTKIIQTKDIKNLQSN